MSITENEPTIIARIAAVPVVSSLVTFTSSIFERVKGLNAYVREGADFVEFSLKMGSECIHPYLENSFLLNYLRKADSFLLNTFNDVVKRYPLIEAPTEEIVDRAHSQYSLASQSVLTHYNNSRSGVEASVNKHLSTIVDQYNVRGAPVVADIKVRAETYSTNLQERAEPVVADIRTRAQPIIADLQERAAPVVATIREQSSPILEGMQKQYERLSQ